VLFLNRLFMNKLDHQWLYDFLFLGSHICIDLERETMEGFPLQLEARSNLHKIIMGGAERLVP